MQQQSDTSTSAMIVVKLEEPDSVPRMPWARPDASKDGELFAKVLFLHEPNQDQKKGSITVTSPTGTTITTTTGLNQRQSKETKETIKYNDNHKKTEKGEKQQSMRIKCISAVLVHPEPNSSSANLTTVPAGATVDFIKNENGWYYITYNGTTGYAWGQFFEQPKTTTQAQF